MSQEWDSWQTAWRADESAVKLPALLLLQRAVARHRRLAWIYTSLDLATGIVMCGLGVTLAVLRPTLPALVWAASIVAFTLVLLAFVVWNRRDALFISAEPTTSFVAQLHVRLQRRARLPGFLLAFAAVEAVFGLGFYAVWSPESLLRAALAFLACGAVLGAWAAWYRRRLTRERAQLDALERELGPD